MALTITDLAPWLSPMQALTWVATRSAAMVMRASLDARDVKDAMSDLGDTLDWCNDAPGLDLLSIDLWALYAGHPNSIDASERSMRDLVKALRSGQVIASAAPYDPMTDQRGTRVDLTGRDWADLNICGEHGWKTLKLVRVLSGALMQGEVVDVHWANLLIDKPSLLRRWSDAPVTTAAARMAARDMLVERMKADPTGKGSRSKAAEYADFCATVRPISERAFIGAWNEAVSATGATSWSKGGRKPKRRTDTPT